MKRGYKILLVLGGIWLFGMIATIPELTAVLPERKAVQQTFNSYADALIKQRFEEAYRFHSPEFQDSVTLGSFVQYQHDVEAKYGNLRFVRERGMTVQKSRSPNRWRASVSADFQYERAKVRFTFEFHRDNDRWSIFNSKGQEE